jgi:hypothetical protein
LEEVVAAGVDPLIKEAALFSGDITSAFLLRVLLLLDVLLLDAFFLEDAV